MAIPIWPYTEISALKGALDWYSQRATVSEQKYTEMVIKYNKLMAAPSTFPDIPITIVSGTAVHPGHIDRMKEEISKSGMAFVLRNTKGIEFNTDPLPTYQNEGGTIDTSRMVIVITNMIGPGIMLSGQVIHEAEHLNQHASGLVLDGSNKGIEAAAYCMQQLYYDVIGYNENLFKTNKYARWTMGLEANPV